MSTTPMRHVVFIGPQGAGKGTQAARIAPRFNLLHLATGDLFRALMSQDSDLAAEVRSYYDRGDLVPDALTARVLFAALDGQAESATVNGALVDGFPRNAAQAEVLDNQIDGRNESLVAVVHIDVKRDVLMRRLTGRLICKTCGATYHREFNPPKVEGICDLDGGELYVRSDDTEEAVARRLDIYFEQTEPLLDRWRERGLVLEIDGDQAIDDVTEAIAAALAPAFADVS
ncbi:MAG: nucleoside monophosphate kinase [Thermomicrobiales bacterium]|nr:nucleoside monophosphate kinase [Thermomicrobiales bacterium]